MHSEVRLYSEIIIAVTQKHDGLYLNEASIYMQYMHTVPRYVKSESSRLPCVISNTGVLFYGRVEFGAPQPPGSTTSATPMATLTY